MRKLRLNLILAAAVAVGALLLFFPSAASARGLNTTGDLTISYHFSGNISIKDGTLTIAGGAAVDGNIEQQGLGGVVIESGASLSGNIREEGAGNVEVYGYLGGNVAENDEGDVIIDLPEGGSLDGNIREEGPGNVAIWAGSLGGNVAENDDGSVIIGGNVSLARNVSESGDGEILSGFTVTFDSNGGGDVAPTHVVGGQALGLLPVPNNPGAIFLGWYTDNDNFEDAVSALTLVTSDLTLYARYAVIAGASETDKDAFVSAQDCAPDIAILVASSDSTLGADDVLAALQVEVLDDTPFAGLSVSDVSLPGGDPTYTVTATEGYTPGSSYKLTLLDEALTFAGEEDGVRTYCYTIYKPEVVNVNLDSGLIPIDATLLSGMSSDGVEVSSLSIPVASVGEDLNNVGATGTFTYTGSEPLAVGDVLAIYEGTPPDQRDPGEDYSDEPVAYVEVVAIDGATVTYQAAEAKDVLFFPDVLPVDRDDDLDGHPGNHALTIAVGDMTYTGEDLAEMGLNEDTVVEPGDFLELYTGTDESAPVAFAVIDSVELSDGDYTITYSDVTDDELTAAMDVYLSQNVDFENTVEDLDVGAMEADIEQQVVESGFAQVAANYLTALALKTDGFQEVSGGLNLLAATTEESDPVITNLEVDADISTTLEHFVGLKGVRCAVTVSFDVPCGEDMTIHLSGTFVEEIRISLNTSGGIVWHKKRINCGLFRIYIPYIYDYKASVNLDLYDFTGIDIKATLTTGGGGDDIDIAQQIETMLGAQDYQSQEISAENQAFYELYGDMLANEHEYVEVFSKEIKKKEGRTLYDTIHYRVELDFVVNADVNLALGAHFAYENAKRYTFALQLLHPKATSNEMPLIDENYDFQFYAMGTLGLRAGIAMRVEVGLFSLDLDSIGIEAQAGPYVRIWGYFFYELKYANKQTTSTASGALYLELGVYLKVGALAQAGGGVFSYDATLVDTEYPLWSAGSRYNVYDFAYVLTDDTDDIHLKGDATTYALPSSVFTMRQLDLKEGDISATSHPATDFTVTFTNSRFSQINGTITVQKPPPDQHVAEGYMTVYWNGGPLSFTTVPISRTYHVVWDDLAGNYMISFDSQGGSLVSAIVGPSGSAVTLPQPTRAGYTFEGWYDNEAYSGDPYMATTMPDEIVQLYAKWTAVPDTPYTVRHYLQSVAGSVGELVETQTLLGATNSQVTPPVNAYAGFTAPGVQTVTVAGDGSTVVEYYYTRNSYQMTFKPVKEDPDTYIVKTFAYEATTFAPTVTRAGYVFAGWYDNEAYSGDRYEPTTMPAHDVELYAKWTANSYQVTFKPNNGGADIVSTFLCGQAIVAPTVSREGYGFDAWYGDQGLTSVYVVGTMPAQNLTLYAGWTTYDIEISTALSSELDGIALVGDSVHDTITLTWNAPDVAPTGSLVVTKKTPTGADSVIYDQPIAATTSPLVITTGDQELSEPGLYQFRVEYLPDSGSLYPGAISDFEQEQITVGVMVDADAPEYSPGMPLPASPVIGTLEGPPPAADFRDWYDVTLNEGERLYVWVTAWTGPSAPEMWIWVLHDDEVVDGGTFAFLGNPDQPFSYVVPAGGAGVYSLLVETVNGGGTYAFMYTITPE